MSYMNNDRYDLLPAHMRSGTKDYIEHGTPPGGFLRKVLENDLVGAFVAADAINSVQMEYWSIFLWNYAPTNCWGSPEKVDAWIEMHRQRQSNKGEDK